MFPCRNKHLEHASGVEDQSMAPQCELRGRLWRGSVERGIGRRCTARQTAVEHHCQRQGESVRVYMIPSSLSQRYRLRTSSGDPQTRPFDSEAKGSPPGSHPGRFETSDTNRDGGDGYHAPSHDIGIGRTATSKGIPNVLHRRHLHLIEDGVVESFEKLRITAGPNCKIDLRGCARRSTLLPPVGIEAE